MFWNELKIYVVVNFYEVEDRRERERFYLGKNRMLILIGEIYYVGRWWCYRNC